MTLIFIRVFFIIVSMFVGYQIGSILSEVGAITGIGLGLFGAIIIITFETGMRKISVRGLSAAVFGLIFGLIMAKLLADAFIFLPLDEGTKSMLRVILVLIFCYLSMVMAMRGRDEFNLIIPYVKFVRQNRGEEISILDTSVVIDGRIADICQTKFISDRLVVPKFVLKELQQIADSQDSLKRNRGRRGLEILHKLQKDSKLDVKIHEEDFPELADTDTKLVKLAKVLNAKIFTTDYNLNRVAELQDVDVLNINELAGALRAVVLPGETMELKVVKEGKEYNQGVAYLDDGTMVVVEEGRRYIGQTIKVIVTSVLQTPAGRMIFTKPEGSKR